MSLPEFKPARARRRCSGANRGGGAARNRCTVDQIASRDHLREAEACARLVAPSAAAREVGSDRSDNEPWRWFGGLDESVGARRKQMSCWSSRSLRAAASSLEQLAKPERHHNKGTVHGGGAQLRPWWGMSIGGHGEGAKGSRRTVGSQWLQRGAQRGAGKSQSTGSTAMKFRWPRRGRARCRRCRHARDELMAPDEAVSRGEPRGQLGTTGRGRWLC